MSKFIDDEKEFVLKVKEYSKQVEKNDKVILTKFLTLREQQIIVEIFKENNDRYRFFGGFNNADRKRCLIYPLGISLNDNLFSISCFKIKYNKRFLLLSHQNVLGTLMSLKLDRSLFGDITFINDECYFFSSKEIDDIILYEFKSINRVPITLEHYEKAIVFKEKFDVKEIIVSSMRVDNIISHIYHLSRKESQQLISNNYVFINWQTVNSQSITCNISDVVSVRKHGRFIISRIVRNTKSNKIVLEIKIPIT